LCDILIDRVLPRVRFPRQYIGGECSSRYLGWSASLPAIRQQGFRGDPITLGGGLIASEAFSDCLPAAVWHFSARKGMPRHPHK